MAQYTTHSIKKLKEELTNGTCNENGLDLGNTYDIAYYHKYYTKELASTPFDEKAILTPQEHYGRLLTMCGLVNNILEIEKFVNEIKCLEIIQRDFGLNVLIKINESIEPNTYKNKEIEKQINEKNEQRIIRYADYYIVVNNFMDGLSIERLLEKTEHKSIANKILIFDKFDNTDIIKKIKMQELVGGFLIINDIDKAEETTKLRNELEKNNFLCIEFDFENLTSMSIDRLCAEEKEKFLEVLLHNIKRVEEKIQKEDEQFDLLSYAVNTYLKKIEYNKDNYKPISTGTKIDEFIDGGFYEQQFILISATTGAGKSTLCLQLADNMAKIENQKVLYFALEQPKDDLISKSLSRIYLENNLLSDIKNTIKKSEYIDKSIYSKLFNMRDIATGRFLKNSGNEKETKTGFMETAFLPYTQKIAKNLNIFSVENSDDFTMENIESKIKKYKQNRDAEIGEQKEKLIVFIDYLQLVRLRNRDSLDAVRTMDYIIGELKRIAREYNIVLIAISSNNREANKVGELKLENMRGSALIEYTADICIAISIDREHYKKIVAEEISNKTKKDTKADTKAGTITDKQIETYIEDKSIRKYIIKFMKNRNYKAPLTIKNTYFIPAYSYYYLDELGQTVSEQDEQLLAENTQDITSGFTDIESEDDIFAGISREL